MKKILSLVLALVMTVSLFTFGPVVSASAAFTDSNSITYKEAVDVISSLEIMGGYSDGSFRPNGALTRGAATKIICCMMLTPAVANTMSNNASTKFTDVPAGHTFAGYISWCVQENIVSGYADGSFHPGDPLSTQAFLKMLLCALGYDQTIEHYTGSGWSNNVTNQALMIGLNSGLATALTGTANVNRQDACLFAFNALKSDLVEYTGTRNTRSVRTTSAARGANIVNDNSAASGATPSYTLQFAEQYFSDLKQTANTTDAFGCPATKWTLKNSDVGTYLATVDKVYYNEDVTAAQVYNDLGLTANASLTFYVNGVNVTKDSAVINRNDDTKLSALTTPASTFGNGVEIRAFRSNSGNAVVLSAVVYYPGTVTSVQSATSSRNRLITISGLGSTAPDGFTSGQFETEEFEIGDVVAYTYSGLSGKTGLQSVTALDTESGSLNSVDTGTGLTLDGNKFANAMNIVYGNGTAEDTEAAFLTVASNYTVYLFTLDGQEMIMWVERAQAAADSYAWVKNLSNGRQDFDYAQASLVFSNGTEQVVQLSAYELPDVDAIKQKVVTYTVDSNNRYTLNAVATTAGPLTIKNRQATGLAEGVVADNNTTFIVEDSASKSYKIYNGMRTTPNIQSNNAYVYAADGSAVMVFVSSATITTSSGDLVFIAANSASNPVRASSTYRTFNAVVAGQITKVNVLVGSTLGNEGDNPKSGANLTVTNDTNKPAADKSVILDNTEYNADNLIISGTYNNANVTVGRAVGLAAPSNGAIRLGGSRGPLMDLSTSVNVYSVSTTGSISKINLSNVKADSDDVVYYTQDNRDITNLFILRVDAN